MLDSGRSGDQVASVWLISCVLVKKKVHNFAGFSARPEKCPRVCRDLVIGVVGDPFPSGHGGRGLALIVPPPPGHPPSAGTSLIGCPVRSLLNGRPCSCCRATSGRPRSGGSYRAFDGQAAGIRLARSACSPPAWGSVMAWAQPRVRLAAMLSVITMLMNMTIAKGDDSVPPPSRRGKFSREAMP